MMELMTTCEVCGDTMPAENVIDGFEALCATCDELVYAELLEKLESGDLDGLDEFGWED